MKRRCYTDIIYSDEKKINDTMKLLHFQKLLDLVLKRKRKKRLRYFKTDSYVMSLNRIPAFNAKVKKQIMVH